MRNKEEKCKRKGQETTIGKIIYGFLLFMPLVAIASAILVNTFNMQTKEESEIHYKYQTNEVNSANDLVIGNIYHFNIEDNTIDSFISFSENMYIELNFININYYDFTNYDFALNDTILASVLNNGYLSILLAINNSNTLLQIWPTFNEDNDYLFEYSTYILAYENFTLDGDFILTYKNSFNINENGLISKSTYNEIDYVETHNVSAEDVFYNSVNKVIESPIFNWAQNSIIYTTLAGTCTALSITNTFIPLLMSYWLIISVIYFLYDIALMLVWTIHKKIHELQESI